MMKFSVVISLIILLFFHFYGFTPVIATELPEVVTQESNPRKRWHAVIEQILSTYPIDDNTTFTNYFKKLELTTYLIPKWSYATYKQFPHSFNQFFSQNYYLPNDLEHKYIIKPEKLVNPITGCLTKEVDISQATPGDITYFHQICSNGVERCLSIIWSKTISKDELALMQLIERDISLLDLVQCEPGSVANYTRLTQLFPLSIHSFQFNYFIPETKTYGYTWEMINKPRSKVEFCGAVDNSDSSSNTIANPLKSLSFPNDVFSSSLNDNDSWRLITDYIHHNFSESEKADISMYKNHELDTIPLYYIMNYALPLFIEQNDIIPQRLEDVYNLRLKINNVSVKVINPINTICARPTRYYSQIKPIPGDVSVIRSKTSTGVDRMIVLIWNLPIDNREMTLLNLIDKQRGIMNICWNNEKNDWGLTADDLKKCFPISIQQAYFYKYPDINK